MLFLCNQIKKNVGTKKISFAQPSYTPQKVQKSFI